MAATISPLNWAVTEVNVQKWISTVLASVLLYASVRIVYNVRFHPLAKYPGPRLAAISNVWYAYNWLTGRWPWKVEQILKRYGDAVRIAPNELVFLTPQAARDIYLPQDRMMETFVKTDFEDLGEGDGGISFETDPVKHREVAKRMAPAFSMRNFKAKEPTLQKYIDLFIDQMKMVGGSECGVEMRRWADWLSLDIAADMTYNRQMNQTRDTIKVNLFGTITQISKRFPLLCPLMYLFVPPSVWLSLPRVMRINSQEVLRRIDRRGQTEHLDYFDQNPDANSAVTAEVRSAFSAYGDITPDSVANLRYLHACLQETFHLHHNTADGLPRMSPGAVVDGAYIPKGVICQISYLAAARDPRYFTEPLEFRPQRWLPADHAAYESKFGRDDPRAFMPFNQGPRACPGSAIAWAETKLYLAKVLWTFNLQAAPGQDISFENDFKFFSMWDKPQFWARFIFVERE